MVLANLRLVGVFVLLFVWFGLVGVVLQICWDLLVLGFWLLVVIVAMMIA